MVGAGVEERDGEVDAECGDGDVETEADADAGGDFAEDVAPLEVSAGILVGGVE